MNDKALERDVDNIKADSDDLIDRLVAKIEEQEEEIDGLNEEISDLNTELSKKE